MKIVENRKKYKTFGDLGLGNCFQYADRYYIKFTKDGFGEIAIDVASGMCREFSRDDIIHEVDAMFVVKAVY